MSISVKERAAAAEENHRFGLYVAVVGVLTALSRLLGMVREMLTSRIFGTSPEQSAFVFAFMVPNLFRKLFGEGALVSAFVPVFRECVERGDMEEARKLASSVAGLVVCILGVLVMLVIAGVSAAIPYTSAHAGTLRLIRIMIPYALFICSAALLSGVLNSFSRFGSSSFAQNILNIMWIGALLAILLCCSGADMFSKTVIVAWTVLAAGIAQCLFLAVMVRRSGFVFRLSLSGWFRGNAGVVTRNMLCGAFGAGVIQINLLLDNMLAFYAADWAPAAISYAERLVYLPLGIIATAFSIVIVNPLTSAFVRCDSREANRVFAGSATAVIAVMMPLSAFIVMFAEELVSFVYSGAEFNEDSVVRVSRALMFYAPGLLVFSMNKLVTPWFHARKDVRTPMIVAVCMVALNLALNCLFVFTLPAEWKHSGIAGSTVFCSLCTFLVLSGLASRDSNGGLRSGRLPGLFVRVLCATGVMCAAALFYERMFGGSFSVSLASSGGGLFGASVFEGLKALFFGGIVCAAAYTAAVGVFCPELRTAAAGVVLRRVRRSR